MESKENNDKVETFIDPAADRALANYFLATAAPAQPAVKTWRDPVTNAEVVADDLTKQPAAQDGLVEFERAWLNVDAADMLDEAWDDICKMRDIGRAALQSIQKIIKKNAPEIERANAYIAAQQAEIAELKRQVTRARRVSLEFLARAERAEKERDRAATRCADLEMQFKKDMETTLRLLATIKYLIGIAERGEGREIRGDETAEQFVLGYVKKLESERDALKANVK